MESVLFFLITEAHFYPGSLQVTSRCAIRGNREHPLETKSTLRRLEVPSQKHSLGDILFFKQKTLMLSNQCFLTIRIL